MPSKNTILKLVSSKKIYIFAALLFVGVLLLAFGTGRSEKTVDEESGIEALDPDRYAAQVAEEVGTFITGRPPRLATSFARSQITPPPTPTITSRPSARAFSAIAVAASILQVPP